MGRAFAGEWQSMVWHVVIMGVCAAGSRPYRKEEDHDVYP